MTRHTLIPHTLTYTHGSDPACLNGLGHMYMHGMGVEKDVDRAVKFLQRAAHDKGHPESHYNLGLIYAGVVEWIGEGGDKKEGAEEEGGGAKKRPSSPLKGEGLRTEVDDLLEGMQGDLVLKEQLPPEVLAMLGEAAAQAATRERQRWVLEERPELQEALLRELEQVQREVAHRFERWVDRWTACCVGVGTCTPRLVLIARQLQWVVGGWIVLAHGVVACALLSFQYTAPNDEQGWGRRGGGGRRGPRGGGGGAVPSGAGATVQAHGGGARGGPQGSEGLLQGRTFLALWLLCGCALLWLFVGGWACVWGVVGWIDSWLTPPPPSSRPIHHPTNRPSSRRCRPLLGAPPAGGPRGTGGK